VESKILIALLIAVLAAECNRFFTIQDGYFCASEGECAVLCSLNEYHRHEIQATDEVPSWLSDRDIEQTGVLNGQDSNLRP
jgi:hypothetical protein